MLLSRVNKLPVDPLVYGKNFVWTAVMPHPLPGTGSAAPVFQVPVRLTCKRARKKKGHKVCPVRHLREYTFIDCERNRIEFHPGPQFFSGCFDYPLREALLISDNPTGYMPPRIIVSIVTPCKEGLFAIVFDQQVRIDHRCITGEEQKDIFRQTLPGIKDKGLKPEDNLVNFVHPGQFPSGRTASCSKRHMLVSEITDEYCDNGQNCLCEIKINF